LPNESVYAISLFTNSSPFFIYKPSSISDKHSFSLIQTLPVILLLDKLLSFFNNCCLTTLIKLTSFSLLTNDNLINNIPKIINNKITINILAILFLCIQTSSIISKLILQSVKKFVNKKARIIPC